MAFKLVIEPAIVISPLRALNFAITSGKLIVLSIAILTDECLGKFHLGLILIDEFWYVRDEYFFYGTKN